MRDACYERIDHLTDQDISISRAIGTSDISTSLLRCLVQLSIEIITLRKARELKICDANMRLLD